MSKVIALFTGILLLANTVAFGQDEHPIDKSLAECMDRSDCITSKMYDCIDEACKQWEAEIEKYYSALMDILPEEAKPSLKKSQEAWARFKDLEFGAIREIYTGIIGSFLGPKFREHEMNILRARALELQAYYDDTKDEIRTADLEKLSQSERHAE